MNRRIRKKVLKKYISDFCYEISTSEEWKKKLLSSEYNSEFPLNKANNDIKDKYLTRLLSKYDLQYSVSKVYPDEAKDFLDSCNAEGFPIKSDEKKLFLLDLSDKSQEGMLFKVESKEFDGINVFSLNTIGTN